MSTPQVILHIVYVHGFRGDHTTFQSFPTDLHKALLPQLPPHVDLRSILYPTYKSRRSISVATENFLNWLDTLPHGPVILCGHSMGGLLIAEAATSAAHAAAKRVVALLAFDVPFLGMHPHVVISGIASLLPNKKGDPAKPAGDRDTARGGALKSEREMNDQQHVSVPAGDGWTTPSPTGSKTSLSNAAPSSTHTLTVPHNGPPPLPPRPTSPAQTPQPQSERSPSPTSAIISRTLNFIESHSNDAFVRFLSKHRSDPLGAAKRWVVESFEFGVCMFDPKGLRTRYAALQQWDRPWVAFWTETMPGATRDGGGAVVDTPRGADAPADAYDAMKKEHEETGWLAQLLAPTLSQTGSEAQGGTRSPPSPSPSEPASAENGTMALQRLQEKELKALRKQSEAHPHSPHHFIVRPCDAPAVPDHRWELVKIRGAKDEVDAHTGLFLPDVNWEYSAFVERACRVVQGWIGKLDGGVYV